MAHNWQDVQSSQIARVSHDPDTNTLGVQFMTGKVYYYSDVAPAKFQSLLAADSVGSHFNAHIKPQHKYQKG